MAAPIEEIAYRNRPPLLEDASIRGPTRTPVPGAMLTLDERDAIETDFRWYRYSKFALPCLCFILLLAITTFGLTAWYQLGNVQNFDAEPIDDDSATAALGKLRDGLPVKTGIPRQFFTKVETDANQESGISKRLRNIRIAYVFFAFFAVVFTFATLCCKPRPKARLGLNMIFVLFLLVAAILAIIAFVWGIKRLDDVRHCDRSAAQTFEACTDKKWKHSIQVGADAFVAFLSFVCLILLAIYSAAGDWRIQRAGWRERERDAQQEAKKQSDPAHLAKHNIRNTRMTFLSILLVLLLIFTVLSAVMIISIHLDLDKFDDNMARYSGWPARNTRLRYAGSAVVIIAVLINMIPFVHRLIAYIFAFIYFACSVVLFVAFSIDAHEVIQAEHLPCPTGIACRSSPFIATCVIEFILALVLLLYVCWEFCLKCTSKGASVHSKRHYALHEVSKHDRSLDSFRPVRCDLTGRVLPAKEYVYRWRFIAGTPSAAAYTPLYPHQPLFPAEGYTPSTPVVPASTMQQPVAPMAPMVAPMAPQMAPMGYGAPGPMVV